MPEGLILLLCLAAVVLSIILLSQFSKLKAKLDSILKKENPIDTQEELLRRTDVLVSNQLLISSQLKELKAEVNQLKSGDIQSKIQEIESSFKEEKPPEDESTSINLDDTTENTTKEMRTPEDNPIVPPVEKEEEKAFVEDRPQDDSNEMEELLQEVHQSASIDQNTKEPFVENTSKQEVNYANNLNYIEEDKEEDTHKKKDVEGFIGGNLVGKIGIAILVIGIGFFVKYAIDHDWINELGRMLIGFGAGALLLVVAHLLHKRYKPFSSVLMGGGIATFYFTTTIAFQSLSYLSHTTAFVLTICITLLSIGLSLFYKREELAVIGLLGGFASPLLVSDGGGKVEVLFAYLLILNIGMLILSYWKRWSWVNVVSFIATLAFFSYWYIDFRLDYPKITAEEFPFQTAFMYGTFFHLIFLAMNVLKQFTQRKEYNEVEVSILLLNLAPYFFMANDALTMGGYSQYKGLFAFSLALINGLVATALYLKYKKKGVYFILTLSFALVFLSMAVPMQFKGSAVTVFWGAEMVMLYLLGRKLGWSTLKAGALFLSICVIGAVFYDWREFYLKALDFRGAEVGAFINRGWVATLFASLCLGTFAFLVYKKPEEPIGSAFKAKDMLYFIAGAALVVSFIGGLFEVVDRASIANVYHSGKFILVGAYCAVFLMLWMGISYLLNAKVMSRVAWGFVPVFLIVFIFLDLFGSDYRDQLWDSEGASSWSVFNVHYLSFFAFGIALLVYELLGRREFKEYPALYTLGKVVFTVFGIYLCSSEVMHQFVIRYDYAAQLKDTTLDVYTYNLTLEESISNRIMLAIKVGFPVVWGLWCFITLAWGMRTKDTARRVISLVVFGIILLKLFIFDISSLPDWGKIIAFVVLGILLLAVSFLYNRLKQILFETEEKEREEAKSRLMVEEKPPEEEEDIQL